MERVGYEKREIGERGKEETERCREREGGRDKYNL